MNKNRSNLFLFAGLLVVLTCVAMAYANRSGGNGSGQTGPSAATVFAAGGPVEISGRPDPGHVVFRGRRKGRPLPCASGRRPGCAGAIRPPDTPTWSSFWTEAAPWRGKNSTTRAWRF